MVRSLVVLVVAALASTLVACGDNVPPSLRGGNTTVIHEPHETPDAQAPTDVATELDTTNVQAVMNATTTLRLRVIDARTRQPLGAMVSIWDEQTGQPLHFGQRVDPPHCWAMGLSLREVGIGGALMTWHGPALWRGEATLPIGVPWDVPATACDGNVAQKQQIPFGRYRLVAHRGPEYEMAETTVDLSPLRGEVMVELPLARAVDTSGYLAADMHVHTSVGSADSSTGAPERVKTEAAVGIEVLVATDHDHNTELGDTVRALWPNASEPAPLVAVNGNEASMHNGHFGTFPVAPDTSKPFNGAPSDLDTMPAHLSFANLHAQLPGQTIIQMNHGRGWLGYLDNPECGHGHGGPDGWTDFAQPPVCSLDFDAMEIMTGYLACTSFITSLLKDWYTMLTFGHVVTATANSDTHYTTGILAGFPRTYVRVPDDRVGAFDLPAFMGSLRAHQAIATSAPFLTVRVNDSAAEGDLARPGPGGDVRVTIRLEAASWVDVDEVRLKVDGATVKTWPIEQHTGAAPFLNVTEPLTLARDAFVTVEAQGSEPLPSFVVGDYIETNPLKCENAPSAKAGMIPFAVTNPIFVDVDGDGVWTAPQHPTLAHKIDELWVPGIKTGDCNHMMGPAPGASSSKTSPLDGQPLPVGGAMLSAPSERR